MRHLAFHLSLGILLIGSCDGEQQPAYSAQSLQGRWELVRGFRNHRETKTLEGVYFLFETDGKMTTNIPVGPEQPSPFEIRKDTIDHKTVPQMKYVIVAHSDSTLVLAFSLRGLPFELHLKRAEKDTTYTPLVQ